LTTTYCLDKLAHMADPPPDRDTGTPRWVKVFGIILGALVLLFVILMLFRDNLGGHGPGRHTPDGHAPPGSGHA